MEFTLSFAVFEYIILKLFIKSLIVSYEQIQSVYINMVKAYMLYTMYISENFTEWLCKIYTSHIKHFDLEINEFQLVKKIVPICLVGASRELQTTLKI